MDFAAIHSKEYMDAMMKAGTPEMVDQQPIGTGPFMLVEYQKDAWIRYKANPSYFRGKQKIDNLVFAITTDAAVRMAKLQTNECQIAPYPSPADLPKLMADPNLNVMHQEGLNVGYLAFNTQKPPFDNKMVRQAINMAIDKAAIIKAVYLGAGKPAMNPIPPTIWSYDKATWHRLGLPEAVQADNEWVCDGSPAHPRGMGLLIQLCLPLGIEPWFIPFQEPWRNGVVERFTTHFRSKFLAWVQVPDFPGLRPASLAFEQRHNGRYRYTRLQGQTPFAALATIGHPLRFPAQEAPPLAPLPKPETGRYHLVRFIRSDRHLDVFSERFLVPPEATYAYVVATIDVARQRLTVDLNRDAIAEWPYHLC